MEARPNHPVHQHQDVVPDRGAESLQVGRVAHVPLDAALQLVPSTPPRREDVALELLCDVPPLFTREMGEGWDEIFPVLGLVVLAMSDGHRFRVHPPHGVRDHLRDDLGLLATAAAQGGLDVGECTFGMLDDKSVCRMIF